MVQTVIDNLNDILAYEQGRAQRFAAALPVAKTLLQNSGYATLVFRRNDAPDVFTALANHVDYVDYVIVSRGRTWWGYKLGDDWECSLGDDVYVTIVDHYERGA